MDRDVGRYPWQQLIAGNEDVQLWTPQTRVLWRVPVAADDAPPVVADFNLFPVNNATVSIGQLVDAVAEAAEARFIILQQIFGKARGAIETQSLDRRFLAGVGRQIAAHQKFGARNPEFDVELAHQPPGQADVVRVHVRDDYPSDGAAFHRTGEQLLPGVGCLFVLDSAVDDGPAVAVFQ